MDKNTSLLLPLRTYLILHICMEISFGMTEVKFCRRHKLNDNVGVLHVTCFEKFVNHSNSTCGNIPDFKELQKTELSSAQNIQFHDCPLKTEMFGSVNLARLQTILSSNNQNTVLQNNTFRGMCSLRVVSLINNSIEIIQPAAFSCLSNVYMLQLAFNNIQFLPDTIFKDMISLGLLLLDKNNLHTVPESLFDNLINLYFLSMMENNIKSLPEKLFHQQRGLTKLYLIGNRIEELNESVLVNLTELMELRIEVNRLKKLRNVFTKNSKLEKLALSFNIGLILYKDSFAGLFNLKELVMTFCEITSLPSGLFKDTQKLLKIDISRNRLKVINSDSFNLLRGLQHLNLSYNEIYELQDQTFKYSTNLRTLNISNNKLSEIKGDSFQGLTSITSLNISFNIISKLDGEAFSRLCNLEELSMNDNLLSSLIGPHPFGMSNRLKLVDVRNNHLTDISNINWQKLPSLNHFMPINNTICDLLPTNFTTKKGFHVHLEHNKLRNISLIFFKNEYKSFVGTESYFYLAGNPLECDCHAYDLYMYLHRTVAKSAFPEDLFCLYPEKYKNLTIIHLHPKDFICNITELCPKNCICPYQASGKVQTVNCSNRGQTNLPTRSPYNTTILDISCNNLTSLAGLNDNIWANLTDILADYNQIESDQFYLPNNIKFLNLHHNKLSKIPKAIEHQCDMDNNFKINISNNLWPCECSIFFFKRYINHIVDIQNVHCIFDNQSWSDTSVIELKEEDFCPVSQYIIYVISSTVLFFLAAVLIFYYRHKLYVLSFLYGHFNSCYMVLFRRKMERESKLFDCFISYSSADREATLAILEELENKPPYYKFCIHERNWLPGKYITTNIVESVQNSRKTLIIISETFLQSTWFYLEFQEAYNKSLEDRTDRLIIIIKGELPDEKDLESDVLHVISSKTYLEWGERWFWEKLRYSIYSENDFTLKKDSSCFRKIAFWFVKMNTLDQEELVLNEVT